MGRRWGVAWMLLLAGCGSTPTSPAPGAAEAVAQDFYEALLRQDWPRAYACLAPESRARCSAEQFTRLARGHRRGLGFEPESVRVRFCEEHGSEATAHVVYTGHSESGHRSYKDGITLRQVESGWGVVLPARFGQTR